MYFLPIFSQSLTIYNVSSILYCKVCNVKLIRNLTVLWERKVDKEKKTWDITDCGYSYSDV